MSLRARDLPRVARGLVRHLQDDTSLVRAYCGDALESVDRLASHLSAAEFYWVAPDMAALAVSAGQQLTEARWSVADRPAPCGLLWWDGGVGSMRLMGQEFPVGGVAWGPAPHGCELTWLIERSAIMRTIGAAPAEIDQYPPLFPLPATTMTVTAEPIALVGTAVATVAATWLLMQQPVLIDRTRTRADPGTRRGYAREDRPEPDITIIDLRRQYVPDDPDRDGEGSGYRHRWVVSGHWRNQAYGPDRALRRQTWIPAYVKGPAGAPLLATERVNVWRR